MEYVNNVNAKTFNMSNTNFKKMAGRSPMTNLNESQQTKHDAQMAIGRYFLGVTPQSPWYKHRMRFLKGLGTVTIDNTYIQPSSQSIQKVINRAIKYSNILGVRKDKLTSNDIIKALKFNKKWPNSPHWNSNNMALFYKNDVIAALKEINKEKNSSNIFKRIIRHTTGKTWIDPNKPIHITLRNSESRTNYDMIAESRCEPHSCFDILIFHIPMFAFQADGEAYFKKLLLNLGRNTNFSYQIA